MFQEFPSTSLCCCQLAHRQWKIFLILQTDCKVTVHQVESFDKVVENGHAKTPFHSWKAESDHLPPPQRVHACPQMPEPGISKFAQPPAAPSDFDPNGFKFGANSVTGSATSKAKKAAYPPWRLSQQPSLNGTPSPSNIQSPPAPKSAAKSARDPASPVRIPPGNGPS